MYFLVNPRASTGHKPTSLGDGVDIPGMPIRIAIGPPTGHRCGDGSVLKNRVTTPPPQKKRKVVNLEKKLSVQFYHRTTILVWLNTFGHLIGDRSSLQVLLQIVSCSCSLTIIVDKPQAAHGHGPPPSQWVNPDGTWAIVIHVHHVRGKNTFLCPRDFLQVKNQSLFIIFHQYSLTTCLRKIHRPAAGRLVSRTMIRRSDGPSSRHWACDERRTSSQRQQIFGQLEFYAFFSWILLVFLLIQRMLITVEWYMFY